MNKEMKRPTSHISQNSIKPALSKAVEFYTDNNRQAYECIRERDEYIDYLESKLNNARPQQALPVVPECVGVQIESTPDDYSAFEALDLIKSKVETLPTEENKDWLQVYNWLCEGIDKQDTFALAFITRKYEVEKPQLFYLKAKELLVVGDYDHVEDLWLDWNKNFTPKKQDAHKFTQQEIDSMQTGSYEQIKVEEEK